VYIYYYFLFVFWSHPEFDHYYCYSVSGLFRQISQPHVGLLGKPRTHPSGFVTPGSPDWRKVLDHVALIWLPAVLVRRLIS